MIKMSNFIEIETTNELEEYSKELYNIFINTPEVYKEVLELGISNEEIYEHITFFNDFRLSRLEEKEIKTYEDCLRLNKFYKVKIIRTNFGFDKEYEALDPYKEFLKYNSKFIFKDFPPELNNVEWRKLENKNIKPLISTEIKNKKWIYLKGPLRSGRTYIAAAFTNLYIKKHNEQVAFIDAPKRFDELCKIYFNDREDFFYIMNKLKNCELLVIDNFGSEAKNIVIRDNILNPLLNARASMNKLTVFTSVYSLDNIKKMYELSKKDSCGEIVAQELINTLLLKINRELVVSNIPLY